MQFVNTHTSLSVGQQDRWTELIEKNVSNEQQSAVNVLNIQHFYVD